MPDINEFAPNYFTGIVVERGAFVTCRDAPAVEMLIRLNRMYEEPSIAAIFSNTSEYNANKESCVVSAKEKTYSKKAHNNPHVLQKMFVVHPDRMEHDIQKWLNPYKRTDVEQAKYKRYRSD